MQSLPRDARVIVRELGGRGGYVRGRFLLANESEMTVLKGGRPVVIPRTLIDFGIDDDRVVYRAPKAQRTARGRPFDSAQGRPSMTLLRVSF